MTLRIAFILLSSIFLSQVMTAQTIDVAPLVQIANDKAEIVKQWDRAAQTQMAWTIAGILCGGLITVLQPWGSNTWCKIAASLLGVGAAAVTGLISKAPVNYSAYEKSVLSARAKIGTLHDDINLLKTTANPEDQKVLRDEFTRTVKEISQIHSKLSGEQTTSLWQPTGVVYAQSKPAAPAWNSTLPYSSADLYFRGESASKSLSDAKTASYQKAVDQGTKQLLEKEKGIAPETVAQYLKSSAVITDTSFYFDKSTGVYRYYTLLRMDRSFARPGVFAALSAPAQTQKQSAPASAAVAPGTSKKR